MQPSPSLSARTGVASRTSSPEYIPGSDFDQGSDPEKRKHHGIVRDEFFQRGPSKKMDDRLRAACRRLHDQHMTLDQIWKIVRVQTPVSISAIQMAVKNSYRMEKDDISKDKENAPDAYLAGLKTQSPGFTGRKKQTSTFEIPRKTQYKHGHDDSDYSDDPKPKRPKREASDDSNLMRHPQGSSGSHEGRRARVVTRTPIKPRKYFTRAHPERQGHIVEDDAVTRVDEKSDTVLQFLSSLDIDLSGWYQLLVDLGFGEPQQFFALARRDEESLEKMFDKVASKVPAGHRYILAEGLKKWYADSCAR